MSTIDLNSIDLNSDVGESFGRWTLGDDAAVLDIVSSANIACGFHAGDPRVMQETVAIAARKGIAIGAHVGYRDLAGFGRRNLDVARADLVPEIIYQIGALQAMAAAAGTTVTYVKPHGALYNTIAHDERQATDVVDAIRAVDPTLPLMGLPGSTSLEVARSNGLPTVTEAFADRAYTAEGRLVSRSAPGSVLHDAEAIAERMLTLVTTGRIEAVDGSMVEVTADSICVHGDSPDAATIARVIRDRLVAAGIGIASFVSDQ